MSVKIFRSLPWVYLAALFMVAFAAHTYFFHLTESVSFSGFSAIETMVQTLKPENFVHDFPSGNVSGASHAIISRLYAPIHQLTGLSGISILTLMIGLEIACLIGAAWVLWSVLDRSLSSAEFRIGLFCWLATMLVSGHVVRPNLSNFGYPFFHGQFYGFADAASLLAIAAMLRARWMAVAALLCLGFMIHPTKTLMAAAFIAGAALAGGRSTVTLKSLSAGVFTAAFGAAWAYFWLGIGRDGGIPPVPDDQYIAYTRGWQYHWYPIDRGLFTHAQNGGISPFLGLQLLGLLALVKSGLSQQLRTQVFAGAAVLAVLTATGVLFSYTLTSAFMIKMALHRASELMVMLTPFIVMRAIHRQWLEKDWNWVAFFTAFLLAGMVTYSAFSSIIVALAVGVYFLQERKSRSLFVGGMRIPDMMLAGSAIIISLFTIAIGIAFTTVSTLLTPVKLCVAAVAVVWVLFKSGLIERAARLLSWNSSWLAWIVISCGFLATSGNYLYSRFSMDDTSLSQSRDFYAAQRWANANTPVDSLFMLDPCHAYGWREFSERSSIGTAVEWFHTGWLYVSDNRVFERGQAIRKTLDIDFEKDLPRRGKESAFISYIACEMAQARFYDPTLAPQKRMIREHGVDYFVMETKRSEPLVAANRLTPVFANSHYQVFVAKDFLP